jgi:hypothetical protein
MGQTQPGKRITATHNARNDRDGHELGHLWDKLTMGTWGKIALPGRIGKASHRSLDGEFLAHLLLGHRRAPVAGSSFSHPRLVLLKSHVIRELPVIRPIVGTFLKMPTILLTWSTLQIV